MACEFRGLKADETSLEMSGFFAGGYVDSSDVHESSIVNKWTAHFLVERDKARKGGGVGKFQGHFNCIVITAYVIYCKLVAVDIWYGRPD